MLTDNYTVEIMEKGQTPIYRTTICGAKTLALNIDIARWNASSFYTITLEGEADTFTARFNPNDYVTAIDDNITSTSTGHLGIFDLTGRRLDCEPQHGVFIRDGRKVVK